MGKLTFSWRYVFISSSPYDPLKSKDKRHWKAKIKGFRLKIIKRKISNLVYEQLSDNFYLFIFYRIVKISNLVPYVPIIFPIKTDESKIQTKHDNIFSITYSNFTCVKDMKVPHEKSRCTSLQRKTMTTVTTISYVPSRAHGAFYCNVGH